MSQHVYYALVFTYLAFFSEITLNWTRFLQIEYFGRTSMGFYILSCYSAVLKNLLIVIT